MKSADAKIGQTVLATDLNGCYSKEPAIVTGFETNLFGRELIRVRVGSDRETVFYPCELAALPESANV